MHYWNVFRSPIFMFQYLCQTFVWPNCQHSLIDYILLQLNITVTLHKRYGVASHQPFIQHLLMANSPHHGPSVRLPNRWIQRKNDVTSVPMPWRLHDTSIPTNSHIKNRHVHGFVAPCSVAVILSVCYQINVIHLSIFFRFDSLEVVPVSVCK